MPTDRWQDADSYERFMGRWSRALARDFVAWLGVRPAARWLEIGCGTGALTEAICALAEPAELVACDTSADYVAFCRERIGARELSVVQVTPGTLPASPDGFDVAVSSLVLNFLPDPVEALGALREACVAGGRVAACVWDYADGMELLRRFWDAAVALDPSAAPLDEGRRFPLCTRAALQDAFVAAGLRSVRVEPIAIATRFADFDDFWRPFTDGPGPAPGYVATLSAAARQELEDRLRSELDRGAAPIELRARAWCAVGYS